MYFGHHFCYWHPDVAAGSSVFNLHPEDSAAGATSPVFGSTWRPLGRFCGLLGPGLLCLDPDPIELPALPFGWNDKNKKAAKLLSIIRS
jgi:hypothetical protein